MNAAIKLTKGQITRQRILDAALALIDDQGIATLSQDATAKRAGISQSTLRHHFTTKDDLLDAVFDTAFGGFLTFGNATLLDPKLSARERLLRLVTTHIDYALHESDRIALESFIYATRDDSMRARRDKWYQWRVDHYFALIGQIRTDLTAEQRQTRATALLTLTLGIWIRMGRSCTDSETQQSGRRQLIAAAELLIDD